jgi:hypothetical protein
MPDSPQTFVPPDEASGFPPEHDPEADFSMDDGELGNARQDRMIVALLDHLTQEDGHEGENTRSALSSPWGTAGRKLQTPCISFHFLSPGPKNGIILRKKSQAGRWLVAVPLIFAARLQRKASNLCPTGFLCKRYAALMLRHRDKAHLGECSRN